MVGATAHPVVDIWPRPPKAQERPQHPSNLRQSTWFCELWPRRSEVGFYWVENFLAHGSWKQQWWCLSLKFAVGKWIPQYGKTTKTKAKLATAHLEKLAFFNCQAHPKPSSCHASVEIWRQFAKPNSSNGQLRKAWNRAQRAAKHGWFLSSGSVRFGKWTKLGRKLPFYWLTDRNP